MNRQTPVKPVEDAAPSPIVRTSKQSGLRDSVLGTRNLMTVAALGVVGSLLVVPLSLVGHASATSPKNIIVLCSLMGAWFIAYALPGMIVRKPGAFMVGGLIWESSPPSPPRLDLGHCQAT